MKKEAAPLRHPIDREPIHFCERIVENPAIQDRIGRGENYVETPLLTAHSTPATLRRAARVIAARPGGTALPSPPSPQYLTIPVIRGLPPATYLLPRVERVAHPSRRGQRLVSTVITYFPASPA